MIHIKCVLVGDENCDKTQLLITYTTNTFPDQYVSTVFDNYTCNIMVDDQAVELQLWDTAGQSDYAKLRPLTYPQTDVFIYVFSLISPTSLESIENMWVPEVREHCPDAPCILVGTNVSKRNSFYEHEDEYRSNGWEPVTKSNGQKMKSRILADDYIECDTDKPKNLSQIFIRAARAALKDRTIEKKIDYYKIGLYGANANLEEKIALKYILGDFHKGEIPVDEQNFIKIEEVDTVNLKITVKVNEPEDLSEINAMLWLYEVNSDYEKLKSLFDRVQKTNSNKIPYVLAVVFNDENNKISDNVLDDLIRDFKCRIFQIRSCSEDDIEEVFYYLAQKIAERVINSKEMRKRKLKTKNIKGKKRTKS